MYHPTTRVLTVLELLQAHECISGSELARRLEVSARSVRQYVTQLQDLGIPVEAERGRYGGYRLRPGFTLPPLMFTADEAFALTLGLLAARTTGLTVAAPALEGALAKVERVLPNAVRQQIQSLHTSIVIDGESPYLAPASEVVRMLVQAAQQGQKVWVRYQAWDGAVTERELDPYGVVHHGGRWFAVGFCHLRAAVRMFRLDRVVTAQPQATTFARPAEFDMLGYVIAALARTPGTWAVDVLLRTPIAAARECVPASMALLEETSEGVVLRCAVQDLEWFARVLVGLSCPVVVRAPPELRKALGALAARVQAMAGEYADPSPPTAQ